MRITPLNYSVNFLSKHYELNTVRVNGKAYSSIEETTGKTVSGAGEAGATNPMHINPNMSLDIAAVFNAIANPGDRFSILMLLSKPDLMNLLFMLDKDKLVLGLNFFSLPKLLELIMRLPKELLIKALLMHMDQKTLLSLMPQRELLRILGDGKINESMLIKAISNLPTHVLIQMMEAILGESVGKMKHGQVIDMMHKLKKRQLLEGILTLPSGSLLQIVLGFTLRDPQLLMSLSRGALTQPFTRFQKSMLIQSFMVLDNSEIIKLLGGLPKNLLAQVACMIDPGELSQVLANQFQYLLSSL
jgi:hypothetical protein